MQLLIDNGFVLDADGCWYAQRVRVYVCEMYASFYSDNTFGARKALLAEPEAVAFEMRYALEASESRHLKTIDYANNVLKVCLEKSFPVRYEMQKGLATFFYAGAQTHDYSPLFLFSLSMKTSGDEMEFRTPEIIMYAEDQPVEIELPELFDAMHTETNYDIHCKEGVTTHNRVQANKWTAVYSNLTHALAECLKYGVQNICHQTAQIRVEDTVETQRVMQIMRSTKFPEVHAYAITFLTGNPDVVAK